MPQRFSRGFPILIAVVVFIFIITFGRLRGGRILPPSVLEQAKAAAPVLPLEPALPPKRPLNRNQLGPGECSPDIDFLRRPELDLTDQIVYSKRCVKPVWNAPERDAITNISDALVGDKTSVDLTSCTYDRPADCVELPIPVASAYPKKKYSHLAFGIASKYDRIEDSLDAFAHWMSGTGAKLVGVAVDADDPDTNFDLKALEEKYRAQGVDAVFTAPRLKVHPNGDPKQRVTVEQHHFKLIHDLLAISTDETTWLGILDDDTFFPSLYPLDQALGRFEASKPWWIGALSDDFIQVKAWGFMAFGGAGSFISMPLAKQLDPYVDQCIREAIIHTGDGMMRDCVYFHTRTRLTIVEGLYQHDIHDDVSGFYESGVHPLSLHHWKSWYQEPVTKMAAVTGVCGDCFLQRYRLENDFLFVNGYSFTHYPEGLDSIDLNSMEGTFPHPDHGFDFSYGRFRPKLSKDQKKSWRLKDSQTTANGEFRQIYVFRAEDDSSDPDEVIELVWPKS
ncbi:hypothetical protein GQ53DRAFT_632889 [Thozetella sp. PMI_491]|nr:hypothetical protein GQ53DRAFT_632889 [Thozetella sp. PMI_491]